MKKIYILPLAALSWILVSSLEVISYGVNPPLGKTGAPSEGLCTDCHGGQPNTGLATVTFTLGTNGDNKYFHGEDNRIDITITSSGRRKFGFEMTALDKNKNAVGTFSAPNIYVATNSANNRNYGFHSIDGTVFPNTGGGQWVLMWKPPVNHIDPVYFYTAFNETNEDGTESGDRIYTRKDTALVDPSVAIAEAKKNPTSFNAFVTSNNKIQVAFQPEKTTSVILNLFAISGQKIETLMNTSINPGATERTFDLPSNIASGVYMLVCESNNTKVVKKILIN